MAMVMDVPFVTHSFNFYSIFFFGYRHFTSLLVGFDDGDGYYGRSQLVILTHKEIK